MQYDCKKNSKLFKCIFGTSPQPGQAGLALSRAWFWARGGGSKKKLKPYYIQPKGQKNARFCL